MKWTFNIQKTFSKILLKKTIGRFIKSDLDSLSIQLLTTNGKFQLSDIQLDVEKINELLKDLPFSLNEVKIGEISTLWDLKNLNISVTLKDFNVILLIEDKQLDEETFNDVVEGFMISSLSVASEILEQENSEDISIDENDDIYEYDEPKSKVQIFSSIIDKIIEKLEIIIENLKISVLFNIDKNKDIHSSPEIKDKNTQKCSLDIVIPNIKLVEGSLINKYEEKIANITKDLKFNELSIYLNYYKDNNEHQNDLDNNLNKEEHSEHLEHSENISIVKVDNDLFNSAISNQDLEDSIFYDARESPSNNDENLVPYNMKNPKIELDKNIKERYCILSCSKNSENTISIIQSSNSVITNRKRSSIYEDKNNTSFEMRFNEWTINASLQNICLFLIPKNIETILLLTSNLIPSLSSNQIKINKSINDIQDISILNNLPYSTQVNKLSKRSSSQSLHINKKTPQNNSLFTFECNLNHCLVFIINDDEEKICLPYFDYEAFMERNFDKFIDCNDIIRKSQGGEMLNEYHIKIDIHDLYFQTSNKSEFYNSSLVNFNGDIKNTDETDLKARFTIKSISLSEWIEGKNINI
ncbi:hypothetical protein U3516DRAFT_860014 [Neocallimastix sp. 'constans']